MGIYINSTSSTYNLEKTLYKTSVMQANIMKRLSSGIRINSASDDAAGLALVQKLNSVINGNMVAKSNTQTGIAYLNTADSALSSMTESLERIRTLAVQSANGVYTAAERQSLQNEASQLSKDITQSYNNALFSNLNVFQPQSATTAVTVSTSSFSTAHLTEAEALVAGYDAAHIIHNAAELTSKVIGNETENFILMGDIDLSSLGTLTDSLFQNTYSGTFDGNGYSLSNLTINSDGSEDDMGIFAHIQGATIKNLRVANINITSNAVNDTNTGLLVGWAEGGTVSNCFTSGSVVNNTPGWADNGGLIGIASGGGVTITNCGSSATVIGGIHTGGLVGHLIGGSINGGYATGNVSSAIAESIGGLSGVADGTSITNTYATGNVSTAFVGGYAGGLIGEGASSATITNSYAATGTVSATNTGGIIAYADTASVDASNFYQNNLSSDDDSAVNANILPKPTGSWNTGVWDLGGSLPVLKSTEESASSVVSISSSVASTSIQVDSDASSNSRITLNTGFSLGTISFDVTSQASALESIDAADQLMTFLNTMRSNVGALSNKLSNAMTLQENRIANLSAGRSTIQDADIATESANLVKTQIRQQAATSLLSQARGLDANIFMQLIS